ncbi:MAG: energy transducer TonB family protein [Brevinema sp.]
MALDQKNIFFRDIQIKYFILFVLLSIIVHAYLFIFAYYRALSFVKDEQMINKKYELQNIILETVQETLQSNQEAAISDKNNLNASPTIDRSKQEIYNLLNTNPQKSIVFEQTLEDQQNDNPIKDDTSSDEGILLQQEKSHEPQRVAQGSNNPSFFDPDKDEVINLYNLGNPSLATHSKDFADYLLKMQKKIEKYHQEFFPIYQYYQGLIKSGTVVVRFTVNKNGDIVDAFVAESYGADTVDNASLNSVVYAKNFGPLPPDLAKNEYIKINFHFIYLSR